MYELLLALPGEEKHASACRYFWRDAGIFSCATTAAADPLKSSDHIKIEDINDEALPATIQTGTYVQPAEKNRQLGRDAMLKLTDSISSGVTFGQKKIMYFDLDPYVGDLLHALMMKSPESLYLGMCHDEAHMEWLRYTAEEAAADLILKGDITFPGFTVHVDIDVRYCCV